MAFFDGLGKKVSEAAQSAAKKSSELVEVTKINMSIGTEEDKIKKVFSKMGEEIYSKYSGGNKIDDYFMDMCQEIDMIKDKISDLRAKIMELKNVKACIKCGAELDKSVVFCPKCGTKQEEIQKEETPTAKICSKCSAEVPEGSAFCQSCGNKVE